MQTVKEERQQGKKGDCGGGGEGAKAEMRLLEKSCVSEKEPQDSRLENAPLSSRRRRGEW